jgi:hypothetical protein
MDAGHLQADRRGDPGGIAGLQTVRAAGTAVAFGFAGLAWRLLSSDDPVELMVLGRVLEKAIDEAQDRDKRVAELTGDAIARRMR